MENRKEALRIRAELALWSGRKALHQPRLKAFQSKYILEQDDVNRLQRGIFSRWKWDYGEKLEKEQEEVAVAKAEWEKMSAMMKEADEKLPLLEHQAKAYAGFWASADTTLFSVEENALFHWCRQAEKCLQLSMEINSCIMRLKEEQQRYSGMEEGDTTIPALQQRVDLIWENAGEFIAELKEREYDFYHLEEEDTVLEKVAKVYPCQLTRSLAVFDAVSDMVKTNSALFGLETDLQNLRDQLAEVFEEMASESQKLLSRMRSDENYFCERDALGLRNS